MRIACRGFSAGGASPLKSELFGRVANLGLAQDFMTDWVSSPSAGGDGGKPKLRFGHLLRKSSQFFVPLLRKDGLWVSITTQ